MQALTASSFYTRPDVEEGASGAAPGQSPELGRVNNAELAEKGCSTAFLPRFLVCARKEGSCSGRKVLSRILSSYLRCHLPLAPEEFVQAVVQQLCAEEQLSNIAQHLGSSVC